MDHMHDSVTTAMSMLMNSTMGMVMNMTNTGHHVRIFYILPLNIFNSFRQLEISMRSIGKLLSCQNSRI